MKQGWERKKLGEVYDVRDGTHDSPKYVKEGFALITSKNLKNDSINYDNVNYILNEDYININKRSKVDKKDVLFAMIGTIGNPVVVENEPDFAIKNVALFKVPKDQDSYFLKYYLDSGTVIEKMSKDAKGATQKFVGLGYLRNFPIPLPPLPEQQRIVAILDEAFASIAKAKANAQRNLENATELFECYLQRVFEEKGKGWEEKKLREVCAYEKNQNLHKNLPYVGLEHIESNTGTFLGSIKPQEVKSSTFHFNEQHVLYGRLRPYLNKVLLPNFEGHCSTEIFPIRVNKEISREFLFNWLITGTTVKKIDSTWTGTRMPRANMHQVLEFDFAFPSIREQQTIVRKLDVVRAETKKLEAIYQQKLNGLEELKKSMLQKAFNGELITTKATPI